MYGFLGLKLVWMPVAIVVTKQLLLQLMISYIASKCKNFATAVIEVIFGGRLLTIRSAVLISQA